MHFQTTSTYWYPYDPTGRSVCFLDANDTEQNPKCGHQFTYSQKKQDISCPFDFCLCLGAHRFPIEISIRSGELISSTLGVITHGPSYTTKYESGCLLNSFALIKGPSMFGFGHGGDQLASVAALGLKPFSVGPMKLYFEGWSLFRSA